MFDCSFIVADPAVASMTKLMVVRGIEASLIKAYLAVIDAIDRGIPSHCPANYQHWHLLGKFTK